MPPNWRFRLGRVDEVTEHVTRLAERARAAAPRLADVEDARLDSTLGAIAEGLEREAGELIAASRDEVADAEGRLSPAVIDRLRLDEDRLAAMIGQGRELESLPAAPRVAGGPARPRGGGGGGGAPPRRGG